MIARPSYSVALRRYKRRAICFTCDRELVANPSYFGYLLKRNMRRAERTVRRGSDAGRSDLQVIGQLLIFSKRYAVLAFEHNEISAAINKSMQERRKRE